MDNLYIWDKAKEVPEEVKKDIEAGRLKNMTSIKPIWRLKMLTELFGPVGLGWYTETTKQWIELGAYDTVAAFVNINLHVKYEGEWSKPIFGTGGSTFIAKEAKGLHTSDEAYKMAYTDALSVACKALGIGADVYSDEDSTKYGNKNNSPASTKKNNNSNPGNNPSTKGQLNYIVKLAKKKDYEEGMNTYIKNNYKKDNMDDLTFSEASEFIELLKSMEG